MKRLGLLVLAFSFLCTAAFATHRDARLARDFDWANDPRSTALSTEGLEEFLPGFNREAPEPSAITAFGDLIAEWSWSSLGIVGAGYDGADIAIDYPYLYLCNQYSRLYQIDISTSPPSGPRYISSPVQLPWGCGMDNDGQTWVGAVYSPYGDLYNREYDGMPWPMSYTGNRFYNMRGSNSWMGGISDNAPGDSIWQLGVGSGQTNNGLWCFTEPGGSHGRSVNHSTWSYTSQRGATYNGDANTFIVGGWNSDHIWEVTYANGTPIPQRDIAPGGGVAGLAYQDQAIDGTAKLWVQHNSSTDQLQVWDWSPPAADDIVVYGFVYPDFPLIGQAPFSVIATIVNQGTEDQNFDTWVEIDWASGSWMSEVINMDLASYVTVDVTYEEWENGLPKETEMDICVYVDNPGDEYPDSDWLCTGCKIGRDCWMYAGDDGVARNFMYFGGYYYAMCKRIMQPGVTDPVAAAWIAVNTCSRGEMYYPWPDPVYDPITIGVYLDYDGNGSPDQSSMEPVWSVVATPADAPNWVVVDVPACAFLGPGGIMWAGFRNHNYPSQREGLGLSYTAGDYELWYGYYSSWYAYPYYQGAMIRACLEYPPLVAIEGLDEFHWTPPFPPLPENLVTVPFHMTFCGAVTGTFSCSGLTRQKVFGYDPEIFIPPHKIFFVPPTVAAEGGDELDAEMKILVPVHALWGEYTGKVFLNYGAGVEEYDFKLVIEPDPGVDGMGGDGSLEENALSLTGATAGGSEVMLGRRAVEGHTPGVFSLGQNHPNPVGDHTSIRYNVAEASNVSIGVYNSAGMLVKNLVNEYRTPGIYTVNWNNVDLSNGVYFYRMNAGDFSATHKMVVMK